MRRMQVSKGSSAEDEESRESRQLPEGGCQQTKGRLVGRNSPRCLVSALREGKTRRWEEVPDVRRRNRKVRASCFVDARNVHDSETTRDQENREEKALPN